MHIFGGKIGVGQDLSRSLSRELIYLYDDVVDTYVLV